MAMLEEHLRPAQWSDCVKEWPCCNLSVLAFIAAIIGVPMVVIGILAPHILIVVAGIVLIVVAVIMAMYQRQRSAMAPNRRPNEVEQGSSLMHATGADLQHNSAHSPDSNNREGDRPPGTRQFHAVIEVPFPTDGRVSQTAQFRQNETPVQLIPQAENADTSAAPPPYEDAMDEAYDPPPDYTCASTARSHI
jgi:hypothetical protein